MTIIIRTVVHKQGNSLRVVIPSEEASKEGLKENDEIEIVIRKPIDIRELFGKLRERPFSEWNEDAIVEWLRNRPEMRGAAAGA